MSKLPMPFNNPTTYPNHSGVDYGQPLGTPIPSSGPGTVATLSRNDGGGFYIWVRYDAGPLVGYHHMDSHDGCPPVGARVGLGSRLGYVGNTGRSTGPHLHSEVAGYATTAGYWMFFDRESVVPKAGPASTTKEDDMFTDQDRAQLKAVFDSVRDRKPGVYANGSMMQLLKETAVRVKSLASRDGGISDADVDAIVAGIATADVDAIDVAELVDGIIGAGLADAVADEIGRRLAGPTS